MSTSTEKVRRVFMMGSTRLADPDKNATPEEAKALLARQHPQLTNSSMTMEEKTENGVKTQYFQLKASVGTKG